jgi:tRNA G10  N-methylase Trm11
MLDTSLLLEPVDHPAKFSKAVLEVIEPLNLQGVGLDPFAGIGGVHALGWNTWGIELEPEWAEQHPRNLVGDATFLPFADWTFDYIVVSPCYGNRMADHHEAKDKSTRHTYRHTLGRKLHPNNAGAMQWTQRKYKTLHIAAWAETVRCLRPGGTFVLNISDHYRKDVLQPVTDWHISVLMDNGLMVVEHHKVETPRQRHGANGGRRPEYESVLVLR